MGLKREYFMTDRPSARMRKRLNWLIVPIVIVALYIAYSILKVAVIEGSYWKALANGQQLQSTVVSASRGTIYDANGSVLAQSATVYTVFCDPVMLKGFLDKKDETKKELEELVKTEKDDDDRKEYQEKLNKAQTGEQIMQELVSFLSQKLTTDTATVRSALNDQSSRYKIIKRDVERSLSTEIEKKLTELKIDGVRCEPTTNRVYPQSSLASNVIGHTDFDGKGIYGIESYYNEQLSGVDGRIITAKDGDGNEIPYRYKQQYNAQNGYNVNLNIDSNIQYMLEKSLKEAVAEHKPKYRAAGIVMNPNTAQVLAMATEYSYDPNEPGKITDKATAQMLAGMDEKSEEFTKKRLDAWSTQWKNKAVSELYFPGSVFKIFTGASALEENAITLKDTFSCNTKIKVADREFNCWSFVDHGMQDLQLAMTHSCNPAFVQIGLTLGGEKFCDYLDAFGFTDLTGIDLPGESMSITVNNTIGRDNIGPVELASSSFGQTNKLTPIQMITAASAIVNGGNLLTPQVVNTITDENGNIVKKNEVIKKRQVISKRTSDEMRNILENVVLGEKGSNCYIQGYRIGGKSGTSQKLDEDPKGTTYVSSYCAFAPADDPQVIMLVLVDEPTGDKYYGSQVAAPVCVSVMKEMLPYLEIFPQYTEEERKTLQVSVPNVVTYKVESAKKTLENLSLNVKVIGKGENVVKQYPSGVSIENGGTVVLCTDDTKPETVTVPSLMGLTRQQAKELLASYNLNLTAQGSGASEQDAVAQGDQQAVAGRTVPVGTSITVTFNSKTVASQ